MQVMKIILWGTGNRAEMCFREGYFSAHNILAIIDSHNKEGGGMFHSLPVYSPDVLNDMMKEADYLVILNQYYSEILQKCWELHIDLEKIIITDNVQGVFFSECFSRLRILSEEFYQSKCVYGLRLIHSNLSDYVDNNRLLGHGKYAASTTGTDYMIDYFRYRTFEFVAREIKNRNVPGALAELGVFKGAFASLINETFPNRKLYLFDTFESFDETEFKIEQDKGRCGMGDEFRSGHAETSKECVLQSLPRPDICTVCQGLFPTSVTAELEREYFAFVSLDVDLEESTYQGLKFFYPRLSQNGYIFLHDYTTHWLQGVKIAVRRYEEDNHILLKKVPLADRGGTLVITK